MSSFFDSFDQLGGDLQQRFASAESEYVNDSIADDSSIFSSIQNDDVFISHHPITSDSPPPPPPPPIFVSGGGISSDQTEFSSFSPKANGYVESDGPILPSLNEMQPEEGFALREWRRQNAIRLEEKEKREKELLGQIIDEAHDYKVDFYQQRKLTCETNKTTNREKEKPSIAETSVVVDEATRVPSVSDNSGQCRLAVVGGSAKLFVAGQEKFHAEANKNYWKTIAELVPNEIAAIEKKRGKKDQDKKTSVVVIQGPKPGKPTDLSRMRQILLKLKHNTPNHLKPVPPPTLVATKDAKIATVPKVAALSGSTEAVAVA
ncbi:hypothetical protein LguiA_034849 [Lonicera macranthoides]